MKKSIVLLLMFVLCLVSCKASIDIDPKKVEEYQDNIYLIESRVDIREEPSISSPIIAVIERDAKVVVTTRTDDKAWAHIKHEQWNGKVIEGWIPASALGSNI